MSILARAPILSHDSLHDRRLGVLPLPGTGRRAPGRQRLPGGLTLANANTEYG